MSAWRSWNEGTEWLRRNHAATVVGNVSWSWECSCGKGGRPTTEGRARAGRDRHLQAERRRFEANR